MANNRDRQAGPRRAAQPSDGAAQNPADGPGEREAQPHNVAAEKIILGAMMLDPRAIDTTTERLTSADFYKPQHATIYSAITAASALGMPTEPIAILEQIIKFGEFDRTGGGSYLHDLIAAVPPAVQVGYYAGLVRDASHARQALYDAARLRQAALSGNQERIDATRIEVAERPREPGRPSYANLMVSGGAFVLDIPDTTPAVWGLGDEILWSEGEALMICGPSGVGKTTITGQLLRARLGIGDKVLGWPVQVGKRVLYLAMDRPAQIRRALHRVFTQDERDILNERCVFWKGPPPYDLANRPETLLEMAQAADADTVIVDSLKDAAIGLSDDPVGAAYNRARQGVLADSRQVLELHHVVKRGNNGAPPSTLPDVYGSAHLVNGAGSVIMLWGSAGDPIVDFKHLKQPINDVGPFKVMHEGPTGMSSIWEGADLLEAVRRCTSGITAGDAACLIFSREDPTPSEIEKARRRLDKLAKQGLVIFQPGLGGRGSPARWLAAAPSSWLPEED